MQQKKRDWVYQVEVKLWPLQQTGKYVLAEVDGKVTKESLLSWTGYARVPRQGTYRRYSESLPKHKDPPSLEGKRPIAILLTYHGKNTWSVGIFTGQIQKSSALRMLSKISLSSLRHYVHQR